MLSGALALRARSAYELRTWPPLPAPCCGTAGWSFSAPCIPRGNASLVREAPQAAIHPNVFNVRRSATPVIGLPVVVGPCAGRSQRWHTTEPAFFAHQKPARLRLRATVDDVARFFQGYALAGPPGDAVKIAKSRSGQPSGGAYVYFSSEEEARRAKAERDRCYMGNRFIEIFVDFETGELEWIYQQELSENVNRKAHGKDNR